jgi:glycosyltransferase involved in cell wall biosynthesis
MNKKKILVLADDIRHPSGVGTQTKYFVESMLRTGKYQFICIGGALKHADYRPTKFEEWGDDLLVFPVDGYGTQQLVRDMIYMHKIDAVWFMTDPRFWLWLWDMEQEIRPNIPMIYYHVWDNFPAPHFNKPYYESNDMVVTMSRVSSEIVKEVAPEVPHKYIPLTVDVQIFKPLEEAEYSQFVRPDKTVFFWNNRNARRKMSGTIVWWFKEFLDKVGHDKATLWMHTDPKDEHGQDLEHIAQQLGLTKDQFLVSNVKVSPQDLTRFYNAVDCTLNISDAEGFGMGTLESLSCGTPIIVNMTGGMQDQVTDGQEWFGIGIQPASKAVVGSQLVPYIYEDRVAKEDFIAALEKIHNMTRAERKTLGLKGREHVIKTYGLEVFSKTWEETMDEFFEKNGCWATRKGYSGIAFEEIK